MKGTSVARCGAVPKPDDEELAEIRRVAKEDPTLPPSLTLILTSGTSFPGVIINLTQPNCLFQPLKNPAASRSASFDAL